MKGFTLLEVMVALAIMAAVVLTVISAFNYHLSVAGRSREESVAILLARGKLEQLEGINNKGTMKTIEEGTFAPEHPEISWKAELAPTDITLFRKFTVTVTWGNDKRSLSLAHYIAR